MILGINAYNIRSGGGVTHLVELLREADPVLFGFKKVIVWGSTSLYKKIDDRIWLQKERVALLNRGLLFRLLWHRLKVRKLAEQAGCDILFVPGGSDASGFKPMVTMSQNLLPFEWSEMKRFGWSFMTIKLWLLRWTQGRSFRKADGVIFLTEYAKKAVLKVTGRLSGNSVIIPHGINSRFIHEPRFQCDLSEYTVDSPCRLLYVSIVDVYKHQWYVAEAVSLLKSKGIPVVLELVGPSARGFDRLQDTMERVDPAGEFIKYRGEIPYEKLEECYMAADIGVFASSCENLPNILLEGMAAGLPMACSSRGPMPEVLGDSGVYFNPEDSTSIAESLHNMIASKELRQEMAQRAFEKAQAYSWRRCAHETFGFLAEVAQKQIGKK